MEYLLSSTEEPQSREAFNGAAPRVQKKNAQAISLKFGQTPTPQNNAMKNAKY